MKPPDRTDPKLLDLTQRYAGLNVFPHSLWKTWADGIDIAKFRGENAYIAQMWGGMTEARYINSYHYAEHNATNELFCMREDDAFGCVIFDDPELESIEKVSRDLIDSALEIAFLRETLELNDYDDLMVLDIGAGYGRFAHRLTSVFDNAYVICTDGVPLSTYLCDYYLKYRGVERAESMPLDQIDTLKNEYNHTEQIKVACNMYSFSEMPLASVNYWLDLCTDLKIPYFFLVPHAPDLVHAHFFTTEPDGHTHCDYMQALNAHGYKLKERRFKFPEAESDKYIYNTEFCLFSREN